MKSIELMVQEHNNIILFNEAVRRACLRILRGEEVNVEDFRNMIDFVRNYADKHHHGKEELILFDEMKKQLGKVAINLIQHGMLVEHDLGRLYIMQLETALTLYEKEKSENQKLDIIANAVSYTKLLERHIEKENQAVYPFAEKNLSETSIRDIESRTEKFEIEAKKRNVQDKYDAILQELRRKYCEIQTEAML